MLLHMLFPKLSKYTGVSLFSTEVSYFFCNLIEDTITKRDKYNIVRPDMVHLLMEARKSGLQFEETHSYEGFASVDESSVLKTQMKQKTPITNQYITAQALLFFFAGFETIASQICFVAYELALNSDIQEKLKQEIDETEESCKGKLSYEALLRMKYLDMVISETLRKWPTTFAVDRICTKSYTIEPQSSDEVPVFLKPKEVVFFPIYALHRDPLYYPDPERFDPDRFSDENKVNIRPFTYMPFRLRPRNCIGSKFALLEMKILFYHLLKKFEIIPTKTMQIPLKLRPSDSLELGLKRRNGKKHLH